MNKTRNLAKPETIKNEPTSGAEEFDGRNEKCKRALGSRVDQMQDRISNLENTNNSIVANRGKKNEKE